LASVLDCGISFSLIEEQLYKRMKLYYDNKYYKDVSDTAAQKIGEALVTVRRPLHIEVDGEFLKTALIELRADDPQSIARQEVALEDMKKFERHYIEWQKRVPENEGAHPLLL